jgi:hypothetical protein
VIRHISVANFKDGTTDADVDAFREAVHALDIPGMLKVTLGPGLGIREGDGDFGLVIDFEDEAAFMRYHEDPEHNVLRAGLAKQIIDSAMACQIRL